MTSKKEQPALLDTWTQQKTSALTHLVCHIRIPGNVGLQHSLARRDREDVVEERVSDQAARVQHQGPVVDEG